jgi:hypothetical protein
MDNFQVVIGLIVALMGGYIWAKTDVIYDCRNFGKTEIASKWFECKPTGTVAK